MDGEYRDQQHDDHGQRGERHKSPAEDQQSANDLDNDRGPAQKKCEWHADRVQDGDEVVRTASEFGVAVFEKSVADDESKRDGEPIPRNRSGAKANRRKRESSTIWPISA
jgi:hypothetical protein